MRKDRGSKVEYILFDVVYEDGTLSSNRKVPDSVLSEPNADEAARAVIEAQDRKVVENGGPPRARIKTVKRVRSR
jgi:hypothetical protein